LFGFYYYSVSQIELLATLGSLTNRFIGYNFVCNSFKMLVGFIEGGLYIKTNLLNQPLKDAGQSVVYIFNFGFQGGVVSRDKFPQLTK